MADQAHNEPDTVAVIEGVIKHRREDLINVYSKADKTWNVVCLDTWGAGLRVGQRVRITVSRLG